MTADLREQVLLRIKAHITRCSPIEAEFAADAVLAVFAERERTTYTQGYKRGTEYGLSLGAERERLLREQVLLEIGNALADLADLHHKTLTNSRKHNPARIDSFNDCDCLSCKRASAALSKLDALLVERQAPPADLREQVRERIEALPWHQDNRAGFADRMKADVLAEIDRYA